MDRRDYKRDSYKGFGDGMSRAFELAAVPVVFGGLGYLVDSWLGTRPLFIIGFVVFALIGIFIRMWFGYDQEMRAHEARADWTSRQGSPS
jgi:F0F1-type ATP synthase assembly protein I